MTRTPNLAQVIAEWEELKTSAQVPASDALRLGQAALKAGQAPLAFDILSRASGEHPLDHTLRYHSALTSARLGQLDRATATLAPLLTALDRDHDLYVDAWSLAGRIAKDRWRTTGDAGAGRLALARSVDAYERAWQTSRDPFPGVNAATLSMLAGKKDKGLQLAREVRAECQPHSSGGSDDYWLLATLGEASVLLGDLESAIDWYGKAARSAGKRHGDIASMRRQLRLLQTVMEIPAPLFDLLEPPGIAVFTGHMLDIPGRDATRFPPALEPGVRAALDEFIEQRNIGFGYCSAACGGDLLFMETLLDAGSEVHVTLPFRQEDFLKTSVAFAGEDVLRRWQEAMDRTTSVQYAVEESCFGDEVLFDHAADLALGNALIRAQAIDAELSGLAVLDDASEDRVGGTRLTVDRWRKRGFPVTVIDLAPLREAHSAGQVSAPAPVAAATFRNPGPGVRRICTMIFADVAGYSRVGEQQAPEVLPRFLERIKACVDEAETPPVFQNTWGDGLYFVFDSVTDGAEFALRMCDSIADHDWGALGLPAGINIRVGIHTGPVYKAPDPLLEKDNYFGTHVNRAARIEPIAAEGFVYVSEQTAALLAASGTTRLGCEYLGRIALPKSAGVLPLYRLCRRTVTT